MPNFFLFFTGGCQRCDAMLKSYLENKVTNAIPFRDMVFKCPHCCMVLYANHKHAPRYVLKYLQNCKFSMLKISYFQENLMNYIQFAIRFNLKFVNFLGIPSFPYTIFLFSRQCYLYFSHDSTSFFSEKIVKWVMFCQSLCNLYIYKFMLGGKGRECVQESLETC